MPWSIVRYAILLGGLALFAIAARNRIVMATMLAVDGTQTAAKTEAIVTQRRHMIDQLTNEATRFRNEIEFLERNEAGEDIVRGGSVTSQWRDELARLGDLVLPSDLPLVKSATKRLQTVDRQCALMMSESVGGRQYAVPVSELQSNVRLLVDDLVALRQALHDYALPEVGTNAAARTSMIGVAILFGLVCVLLMVLCDLLQRLVSGRLNVNKVTEADLDALGAEHGVQLLQKKTPQDLHRLAQSMVAAHLDIERSMREQAAQIEQQTRELEHEMAVRRMAEKQVRHAAFNDHLTGLCNRELLIDRLRRCTTRAQRHKDYRFAVLYMGVDRFKEVNDSLGHSMGDRLLVEMAARLETALKSPGLPGGSECNTIARIGGDDFVVLIEGLQAPSDAIVLAGQLQKLLSTPFDLEGHEVFSTMSIGIATSELDYDSSEELLRDADVAMHHAKDSGRARYEVFSAEMHERARHRLSLATEFRHAVDNLDFRVMFQPIVNIESMRTRSFEALIRWAHPERGLISPVEFIEHAEETGLIIRIGDWILNESCRLLASWRSAKIVPDDFSVGVNISKRQLVSPDLVGRVTQALTTHGLPGHCLSLEVTESSIVTCPVHLRQVLIQLKDLGVSIHMDDFGTGYSSLSQLHRLPVDVLKVDQEFVGTLNHTDETARIIPTIVILAHHLDMKVTVEGVENAAQLQRLVELQCDNVQGFHFSPPVSAEEAPKLILRDWSKIAGIATPSRVKRPAKAAGKTPPKGASGPRRAA